MVAVAGQGIDEVIDHGKAGFVEHIGEVFLGHGHPHGRGESLPEGTGGGFHAGGESTFRVSGGEAFPLPEVLDFFERKAVPGQVEHGVQQHGTMAGGEHETVAVGPCGVLGIVSHNAGPDSVSQGRGFHGHAGVARVGLLYGVNG